VPEEKALMKAETIDTEYSEELPETYQDALDVLGTSKSLDELQTNWASISKEDKKIPAVLAFKDELKTRLS
jgi:hypothetical protein